MRICLPAILAAALTLGPSWSDVSAQARPPFPPVLATGLDSLIAGNSAAAVHIWTATWTGPSDSGKEEQLATTFEQVGTVGGRALGYDWIRTTSLGSSLRTTYLILRYERLPVYARFALYQPSPNGPWVVASVNFNTDSEKVFPKELLEGQR